MMKQNKHTPVDACVMKSYNASRAPCTQFGLVIVSATVATVISLLWAQNTCQLHGSSAGASSTVQRAYPCHSSSTAGKVLANTATRDDAKGKNSSSAAYDTRTEHLSCAFLRAGSLVVTNELRWGPYPVRMCDAEPIHRWMQHIKSNCYSCLDPSINICNNAPNVQFNQYLEELHPKLWEANLLSFKAFLMTQNLHMAKLVLWVPSIEAVVQYNTSKPFFDTYADYIDIRVFDYAQEVQGTTWQDDPFFGNGTLVKSMMPDLGSYTDVVRTLILHKYGGVWMDNDVIFYQDVTHLMAASYQFVLRWMNLHIMHIKAGSQLSHRAMQLAKTMPLNHPNFYQEIIQQRCVPNGYFQIAPHRYNHTDVYNACLYRLLLRHNNTGAVDNILYDMPLSWFDQDWVNCQDSRRAVNETRWQKLAGYFLAMHTRYPGQASLGDQSSPLRRAAAVIDGFFSKCQHVDCLPLHGMPLLSYEWYPATQVRW